MELITEYYKKKVKLKLKIISLIVAPELKNKINTQWFCLVSQLLNECGRALLTVIQYRRVLLLVLFKIFFVIELIPKFLSTVG